MADITLRPVTAADLDHFEAERSREGDGPFQWFGHRAPRALRERWERDGLLSHDGGVLAVEHDGGCVGRVEWFPNFWGPRETSRCWTIAIGILPGWRGRGIGTAAQRALVGYLFDHTPVERVQAFTDVANLAEQRALEKVGFQREGVVRRAQWREGAWHDQVLYSVLRDER
ncbi:GNAT family N-acetyltransferase [Cellulomonas sp. PhB143]|uniref:GNAT family N-acetyltransferase n=1 Tax=Cellulomonas sp. PhB143 TaxID=2485186 RepID=UPI000F49CD43|nr:GNAT family protein [Cellulomonas sp. PhB143]ROS75338.1 aminoglycoside 6'-N-acetyltransferase [Cellulomonas sp. PhB143]